MPLSRDAIRGLLSELAEWLRFEDCEPVEWVVCGGAALGLQNLGSRNTRDVDVVGNWDALKMEVVATETFPEKVNVCINRVAANHPELVGLGARWVNLGPGRLARFGLPAGYEKRLTTVRFGETLTLHLIGRDDLLPLKLYAAADEFGERQEVHFQDLQALSPTFAELDKAVDWMRTLPDFEEKRTELKEVLRRLGRDDLAYYA